MSILPRSQRNSGIDAVRVVGIVAIVAGHVWGEGILRPLFYSWHVPVFFFLTGYLWGPGRGFGQELRRRSQSLIKPYVFWFCTIYVVYLAVLMLRHDISWERIWKPVYGGALATQPFSTFWFVFALFSSAVLWRVLERIPYVFCVSYVVIAVLIAPFAAPFLAGTPLAVGSSLLVVVFVAAGRLARTLETRMTGLRMTSGWVLLLIGLALPLMGLSAPLDLKRGDWGTPVLSAAAAVLISWGLVLVLKQACDRIGRGFGEWQTRLALCGFTVVLLHPLVLWVAPESSPVVGVFLAALIVPGAIGWLGLRTPISEWVTGVPRR